MKHMSQRILLAAVCLIAAGAGHAQSVGNYPTRPVRMIIPVGPGGSLDFVARILQPKLSDALGQQVVPDNRPGADGNIGVELAVRAEPTGYTILLGHISHMTINPSIYPKFPFKPVRDLTGITLVVDVPGALAVNPSVPVVTVKGFIEYAKARPGQLNYGSSGAGSVATLALQFLMRKSGIELVRIPYKGGAGAATLALLRGEVAVTMATVASFLPYVGKLKVLAVIAPKRISQMPDTPTMAESGFPELTTGSWLGVYVPARTPQPIVNKLYSSVIKVMNDPWVVERLANGGAAVMTSKSPAEFAIFMKNQTEFWGTIVKELGATAE